MTEKSQLHVDKEVRSELFAVPLLFSEPQPFLSSHFVFIFKPFSAQGKQCQRTTMSQFESGQGKPGRAHS